MSRINSNMLPDALLKCMPKSARAELGKAGRTNDEIQAEQIVKSEREMQRLISSWLKLNSIPFVQARNDRKSTIKVGWPDFTFPINGRFVAVEVKFEKGDTSTEQDAVISGLIKSGALVFIVRSFVEFLEVINKVKGKTE